MAVGPFARILAQFAVVAGGAIARSVVNAYKEAAARGASNPASASVTQALKRRMTADEAARILEVELGACDKEKVLQRFKIMHEANAPRGSEFLGSPYIQRRVSNAHTVLMEHLQKVQPPKP
jgi:hypothetical protein